VSGWDGTGRGGYVTFGTESANAAVVGDPGTTPSLANFTQINSTAVAADLSGIVSGTFLGHNGTPGQEGQFGGLIVQVVTVPEPSTYALLAIGAAGLALLRYRAKRYQA